MQRNCVLPVSDISHLQVNEIFLSYDVRSKVSSDLVVSILFGIALVIYLINSDISKSQNVEILFPAKAKREKRPTFG